MMRRPHQNSSPHPENAELARRMGLVYVNDSKDAGYTRKGKSGRFSYWNSRGQRIRDTRVLERIRHLAIPPAYTELWICANPRGHIQAVGRDARGRKQYRYHPLWRKLRDADKYSRMFQFAKALPRIRARCRRDLARKGLPREKVLAAVVQLLDKTLIRVGNDEYARTNHSFGLTTLRNDHVLVRGAKIRFEFRGKSGVEHEIAIEDPRLSEVVRRCQGLPGEELFEYVDDEGVSHDVGSDDVNQYLKEISGRDFTAKDFRTWAGTLLCLEHLRRDDRPSTQKLVKRRLLEAVDFVAGRLGNTRAVCRKSYIHPSLMEAYLAGEIQLPRKGSCQRMLFKLVGSHL